ncbi:hypothetical protein [uncultured Chryseobacterium sp.]|uniref:hypothetical protein n=1 Tax=uncultured Chryseobacterium sp. TaxID=259322 RepID=UPI0025CDCC45|nr:hypothetical protein [uncultured Chryseobacterium sp.]
MKNIFFILMASVFLLSCKSKNDKIKDFVAMYNRSSTMINSPMVRSTSAVSSKEDVVDIYVKTTLAKDETESQFMGASIPDLLGKAISSEEPGKELLSKGVKFNIRIYDINDRIITGKTIDKNNLKVSGDLKSIAEGNRPTSAELNELLETFNKNLPVTDPSTGTKTLSIKADTENNIVYTNEVTGETKELITGEGAEKVMKDEMLRSPQVRSVFSRADVLGIRHLKYVYQDSKGHVIKEIILTKEDLQ